MTGTNHLSRFPTNMSSAEETYIVGVKLLKTSNEYRYRLTADLCYRAYPGGKAGTVLDDKVGVMRAVWMTDHL